MQNVGLISWQCLLIITLKTESLSSLVFTTAHSQHLRRIARRAYILGRKLARNKSFCSPTFWPVKKGMGNLAKITNKKCKLMLKKTNLKYLQPMEKYPKLITVWPIEQVLYFRKQFPPLNSFCTFMVTIHKAKFKKGQFPPKPFTELGYVKNTDIGETIFKLYLATFPQVGPVCRDMPPFLLDF